MAATRPVDFGLPLTGEQRKAIFAAGRAHGLDIDGLRGLTPAGSISALTRLQAATLLDRLNAGIESTYPKRHSRAPRRPKGVYGLCTTAQRNKIEALRIDLGWTAEGLSAWLGERHYPDGRPMTKIDSSADASAVIELLKAVLVKARKAGSQPAAESLEGHPGG